MGTLLGIISEYVGVEPSQIDITKSISNEIGIDSFGLISMVSAIEEAFEVKISDEDLMSFQTVGDFANFLQENSTHFEAVNA